MYNKSCVESFGDAYDWNINDMKLALDFSDVKKDELIPDYPTYTFSDNSYIMIHGNDYTISYINTKQEEYNE